MNPGPVTELDLLNPFFRGEYDSNEQTRPQTTVLARVGRLDERMRTRATASPNHRAAHSDAFTIFNQHSGTSNRRPGHNCARLIHYGVHRS